MSDFSTQWKNFEESLSRAGGIFHTMEKFGGAFFSLPLTVGEGGNTNSLHG
ncbi:MAG: hypothetical protein KBF08_08150 [Kiritimatiellae bacterium]|nr:hypothetical protein [Kiritimatiellia bacterium]